MSNIASHFNGGNSKSGTRDIEPLKISSRRVGFLTIISACLGCMYCLATSIIDGNFEMSFSLSF